MGWGSGNLGGGGGGGLNFIVEQFDSTPTGTAKENTIGVVTDTTISGWVMQAEEPTGTEGLVWIEVAATSDVPFFADKKEMVKVYPKQVKQYVGGAWESLDAYIYQNGAWVQFASAYFYLFDEGNLCTNVTGGWQARGWKYDGGGSAAVPTMTVSDGVMQVTLSASSTFSGGVIETTNDIDLTDFSSLYFVLTAKDVDAGNDQKKRCRVSVYDRSTTYASDIATYVTVDSATLLEITKIDVSELSGSYAIGHYLYQSGATWSISKMWLE